MNKKSKIILIIFLIVLIGIGIYFYFNNSNQDNTKNYETDKTSTLEENTNTSSNKTSEKPVNESESNNNSTAESKKIHYVETPLSDFTTKIYSKDSARQNNINITSNTLNGTIVKKGEEFSFCNTVGKATSDKGYLEADIYDRDGNKQKGLGGGNCQISTTLYNAILKVPELAVTERHEHSNYVPYVEKGKDAAVAYGSYDLKFQNNTENDIKIYVQNDYNNITINLVSLKEELGS